MYYFKRFYDGKYEVFTSCEKNVLILTCDFLVFSGGIERATGMKWVNKIFGNKVHG